MFLSKPRIKVALTLPLHRFVAQEASRAGMSKSEFIRHLVMARFQEVIKKNGGKNPPIPHSFDEVPSELFNEHI